MPHDLPELDHYRQLFADATPLLDVRAPVEFSQGAFPGATNLPLVGDLERQLIGVRYKQAGQEAALALGTQLVAGAVREARIQAWVDFAARHPNAVLYCFRGGMRSQISQRWLFDEAGVALPRVRGGYQALRRFLIQDLEAGAAEILPVVMGGRTGVGKTRLLRGLENAIDLETLAWHRGSAFGRHATPQPTQIDFENRLAVALLRHREAGNRRLIFEDESRNIGSRNVPGKLFESLKAAPLVILEASLEERVDNTLQEYVVDALAEYETLYGERRAFERWSTDLLGSLDRIRKRLGGARHQALRESMLKALQAQRDTGDRARHRAWIAALLTEYYDPMYDYQIAGNAGRILFSGERGELLAFLARVGAPGTIARRGPTASSGAGRRTLLPAR